MKRNPALEQCPCDNDAVSRHILALSTYLGHAHVHDTYWYLQRSRKNQNCQMKPSSALGTIEAKIIALLHDAAREGTPCQCGKDILTKAGSRCLRMQDVFKSQPGWRELIESDGRRAYRLILGQVELG
jgi:hypothetical protein